jgi:hypothetical protein
VRSIPRQWVGENGKILVMSRIEELEREIERLELEAFARIAHRVHEEEQRRWDDQLDRDAGAGKLDFLFEEARTERAAGQLKGWPPSK